MLHRLCLLGPDAEAGLHLLELGQVQSSNGLGLLNLLLVGLDLGLEVVDHALHPLLVLLVLLLGAGQLLDVSLGLAEVLLSVSKPFVLSI